MKDLSALLPTLVTLAFLTQLGMALMALGRMLYLGWRTGNEAAFSFLRQASIAGLPCLAALLAFLWVFMTADPLWPAQDAPPEIEAAYRIARENADHYYRLAGVANLVACLWSLSLLRKAWRQTSNMPARGNAGDA